MRGEPCLVVSIGCSRWGVETDQVVAGPFEGRISFVRTVSFSPDGGRVQMAGISVFGML